MSHSPSLLRHCTIQYKLSFIDVFITVIVQTFYPRNAIVSNR